VTVITPLILYFGNKEIITGETAANVRVHIPRIVVRIDRPRTGIHAIVPVPAEHRSPFGFVNQAA
jgi:hypothetical protein